MGRPTHLLTIEVGGGYDVLESTPSEYEELMASEEIVVISGTITVSP